MFLKRLELRGFKSFADPTVIDVNSGITAIVGPNGSGKSNISDAVRWVMGEMSAKSLRGSKMEDVIFAGTEKRKKQSLAEVSLVLDNTTKFLASEYNEVCVTRRMFRSGESEYLINKNSVRLRDVQELFMDTGLGRDGYSIVGQGKIDEILSAKSEDRRQVFEEAAGISKYRHRKDEAERKLARTEDNLTRVRDIEAELSSRVEPLRAQSEKAREYLDLRESLKGIEITVLTDVIDQKRRALAQIEENYAAANAEFNAEKARLEEFEAKNDTLFEALRASDEALGQMREALSALEGEKSSFESEKRLAENNIENHRALIASIEESQKAHEGRNEDFEARAAQNMRDIEAATARAEALDGALSALKEENEKASELLSRRAAQLEESRTTLNSIIARKVDAQSRLDGMDLLTESIHSRRFSVEVDITNLRDEIARLENEAAAAASEREKADEKSRSAQDNAFTAHQALLKAQSALGARKDEYNAVTTRLGESESRHKTLCEMERDLEGYGKGVRDLCLAHEKGQYGGRLRGILSKLVTTDKEYITAVETALGNAMQNVVVENEEDAKRAIAYLKENKLGRVTFLPISTQRAQRLDNEGKIASAKGFVAIAADVVKSDIPNVVGALLGRSVIVDNIDNAVLLAREYNYRFKIVTLSGELLAVGGAITGGTHSHAQALLGRAEEISRLEELCRTLRSESRAADKAVENALLKVEECRSGEDAAQKAQQSAASDAAQKSAAAHMKESLLGNARERYTKLSSERDDIARQISDADEMKQSLTKLVGEAQADIEAAEAAQKSAQDAMALCSESREKLSAAIMEKALERTNAQNEAESLKASLAMLRESQKNAEAEKENQGAQIEAQKQSIEKLTLFISQTDALIAAKEKEIDTARENINKRIEEKSGTDSEISRVRTAVREQNDRILALQNECVRIESKKNRAEYDLEASTNRLWDEYNLTYTTALPHRREITSLSAAQKEISHIKNAIKALGNINVDAIEEYKEVRERYDFLRAQLDDLEKASGDLKKVIQSITVSMREQFCEKFKIINEAFSLVFRELFGGGQASVKLCDEGDILSCGIDIEVSPPGKKLQNISLLSGGEKALTAIALLFAMHRVSPSPFLILDEIEAALDDVNVYRFGDYVRHSGGETQYIIITHRQGTMEAADILYGVTMQERGVSKLLTMRLDEMRKTGA